MDVLGYGLLAVGVLFIWAGIADASAQELAEEVRAGLGL